MMSMSRPGRRALALVVSISPSRLYVRSGMGLYHLHATIPYRRALAATALLLSLILPRSESSETVLPRYRASRLHETLEPAIDHALGVERQRLGVHHAGQPLVGHHPGVDAVALRARLVGDPGNHHGLARLELDAARERGALADLDVLGHPFAIFQRAMLAPDLARLLCQAAVGLEIFLRHRDNKSIDVSHLRSSFRSSSLRGANGIRPQACRRAGRRPDPLGRPDDELREAAIQCCICISGLLRGACARPAGLRWRLRSREI